MRLLLPRCRQQDIYTASQFALDETMVYNAQSSTVAIMERAVSFLKTEQARGVTGLLDLMTNLEANLKDPPVRKPLGMAIIDHILSQPRLSVVFDAVPKPEKGSTGIAAMFHQPAELGPVGKPTDDGNEHGPHQDA